MYIPDLQNVSSCPDVSVLAVGWIDRDRPFTWSEAVDGDLVAAAQGLVDTTITRHLAVKRTRGIHRCNICKEQDSGSNACILLPTEDSSLFFLTTFLLPHYVRHHRYLPPEGFIRALRRDLSHWDLPSKRLEHCIDPKSDEGEQLEREQLRVTLKDHPDLLAIVLGETPARPHK